MKVGIKKNFSQTLTTAMIGGVTFRFDAVDLRFSLD